MATLNETALLRPALKASIHVYQPNVSANLAIATDWYLGKTFIVQILTRRNGPVARKVRRLLRQPRRMVIND